MKKNLTVAAMTLCLASAALAQPYPSNGFIGLYGDAPGTQCCFNAPGGAPANFYLWATLGGATASGISGAEFRMVFSQDISALGFFQGFVSPVAGSLILGNAFDFTINADGAGGAAEGMNIAFPECQAGTGGRVFLGSVNAFITGAISNCEVTTRRRNPPTNPTQADCALFTLCDGPTFTKVCMTIPTAISGEESIAFRSGINRGTCNTSCTAVGVDAKTWSTVKSLFR